jgi:hypothetical protein
MTMLIQAYDRGAAIDGHVAATLGLRLAKQRLQSCDARGQWQAGNELLLLHPHGRNEPRFHRYVVGILALGRETAAGPEIVKGRGQIVLTERRIVGLVSDGTHNGVPLSEAAGTVVGFTLDRSDIMSLNFPTNWRGRPKRVVMGASSTNSRPYDIMLDIQVVVLSVSNDGRASPTTVQRFIEGLDDEGVRELG